MSDSGESLTEEALHARCLAGEAGAWQTLFQRHQDKLLAALRRRLGPDLAEEVAAALWCTLLEEDRAALRRFDPQRGTLGAFLFGMARREVRRLLRGALRPVPVLESAEKPVDHRTLPPDWGLVWDEFLPLLTPTERWFLEVHLLGAGDAAPPRHSTARLRKLKERVLAKLKPLLRGKYSLEWTAHSDCRKKLCPAVTKSPPRAR